MKHKRKSISTKLRFEIFKRDKFTCQYCGRSAPEVVLNIDHINPIANGGDNDMLNLITSCFECNSGKKDRLLNDDSVITKQKKQLEELQERREQLELMLEWKKHLLNLEEDKVEMIAQFWNDLLDHFSLTDTGRKKIKLLLKKFTANEITDAMLIVNEKYVKYDENAIPTKESVNLAYSKIGGVCALKKMPPIKQKLSYVKGICRNRFNYWDNKKGSIILNNYIESLKNAGYTDEDILFDVETELTEFSKTALNWRQWKYQIIRWTNDLNNRSKNK